ncbi:TorF family putative porin [Pseudoalteromonas sp. Of7M-16]|uniref:TorF family putative porin n=1 Tax=Pseudoalteromonas sp. Of7M-16 TaxID=2917756 RepID=UPI001EF71333|nr:TorF family putative porin [Pseudoalteromonas sp. Of7M-16]MCG7551400.1 TorF family putative porin [Pseudoalteromonas sp. Of7M-16]
MTNKASFLLGACLVLLSSNALAASGHTVSANAAASSNYFWRGITQSDDGAAVSGGLDYSNDSGFYLGTWASNVDFGETSSTSYELDFYLGFSGEIKALSYDIGYIHYAYPDAAGDIDFGEVYTSLGWRNLSFKASYLTHAQSGSSTEEDMLYLELNATFPVFKSAELGLHVGNSRGDTVMEWTGEDDSYMDYGVNLSKDGYTFGLVKTDLDADDDLKVYVSYAVDFDL